MSAVLEIRYAVPEDLPVCADVLVELRRRGWSYPPAHLGDNHEAMLSFLEREPVEQRFCAVVGTAVVGHVQIDEGVGPVLSRWLDDAGVGRSGVAEIARLFVHPTHHGHGIGARLLHVAVAAATATGRHPMLVADDLCSAAHDLYRRCGLTAVGETTSARGTPHRVYAANG